MKPYLSLKIMLLLGMCVMSISTFAQDPFFQVTSLEKRQTYYHDSVTLNAASQVNVKFPVLTQFLLNKKQSTFTVNLPMPDGSFSEFVLTESPVYAQSLFERYPVFRTFEGVQSNNVHNRGRFDISPHGFHGMFWFNGRRAFIDPKRQDVINEHYSYFKDDAAADGHEFLQRSPIYYEQNTKQLKSAQKLNGIKTYRLAIAAAGEYTAFHGGTKVKALAAIVTAVNRLNEIYITDLGVKFELVANNDSVIFTNAATDPFDNTDGDLDANENVMNSNIGSANYDIGHVFNTGGGGLAYLGVVCNDSAKWGGMTGSSSPTADPFVIDYVAHELGHQFGAEHTFNGTTDACSNRSTSSAYEPGSGSTIMAYAGICGEENLQRNSDAFFHSHSLNQINSYLGKSGGCAKADSITNQAPIVNAGKDYAIPANTPFKLTGSATDAESDALSFSWEQVDLGASSSSKATMVDDGSRPIFRAWLPTNEPVRYIPRLSDVLAQKVTIGESYATTNRTLNFKLVVRDGKGNTASDSVKITSITTTEPFSVVTPKTGDVWASNDSPTVTWKVAGTTNAPISCANVDILLAQAGSDFSQVLVSNTANDGAEQLSVPSVQTTSARLMIRCSDNIFFAVNNGSFSISGKVNAVAPIITGQKTLTIAEDSSLSINLSDLTVQDPDSDFPSGFSLKISTGNNYSVVGNQITPAANFNGVLSIPVTVNDGKFDSQPFVLNVTVSAVNDPPTISGSATITEMEDVSFSLSLAQFTVTDVDSALDSLRLLVLAGSNYSANGLTVTPNLDFSGELVVNVRVTDGQSESTTYQAPITITAVNDAPVITGQKTVAAQEDTEFAINQNQLTIIDPDTPISQLTLSILSGENYSVNNGKVKPSANYNGNLSVNVSISDGVLSSPVFPMLVQITAVNDIPVANNDTLNVTQDSGASVINVLGNDTDIDGDPLSIIGLNYTGAGVATQSDGGISYTPATGFTGSESLTYTISDSNGGESTASVLITVAAKSQPQQPTNEGGGGGSLYWSLSMLFLFTIRRRTGLKQ